MEKKVLSDLDRMNKDRARAEQEYMKQREDVLNIHRMLKEGIVDGGELFEYLVFCVNDCKHMEDKAREGNNSIIYSEAIGIRREFTKLLKLLSMAKPVEESKESGTEAAHRVNNTGDEAYA